VPNFIQICLDLTFLGAMNRPSRGVFFPGHSVVFRFMLNSELVP